ncbi:hypothetical protein CHH28_14620 [Bacterioplanes sanyensis]|uniref:ImpA N-terminal domain-containing protein n=2 Tax=Bacterioplanes sanyensis TaxID=1249553 RepID=A0A222FRB7_9GAMM|nr:hypothetical protein CHH28_14620 [Bacterioplanes sanyensis]
MAPIADNAVGESVRHNGVYFAIKEARRADDPTLPQGVWTHELKTADWEQVEKTAINALCHKSKDLQLGVWLMESSIHRYGFAGIAPAAMVIRHLCQAYWDTMHPQMEDGDIEFRTNPINWINEKLSLQLRLVPITHADIDGIEMSWSDWENTQRYEQLKRQQSEPIDWNGPTTEAFKHHMAATGKDFLLALSEQVSDGERAIDELTEWLDTACGNDSPSLTEISHLLRDIKVMTNGELQRRGVQLAPASTEDASSEQDAGQLPPAAGGGDGGNGPLNSRADAFALLYKAAEFLMRDDPHSPVPYLVYTACAWGEKSAPDLYQELFLQKGGQLNIFDVMGLETSE